jgi:periplasmic divalent cation tolerance protein
MQNAHRYRIVLVTAPDSRTGRRLAKLALESRLAACVNLIPKVESLYWWKGKIEQSGEVLLVLKTNARKLPPLEKLLVAHHPYDTPEILSVPLSQGNRKYLSWLEASL